MRRALLPTLLLLSLGVLLTGSAACSGPAWSKVTGTVTRSTCGGIVPGSAGAGGAMGIASRPSSAPILSPNPGPGAPACRTMGASGVQVNAANQTDGSRFVALTDSQGRYTLSLPGGDYSIFAAGLSAQKVSLVGYPEESRVVDFHMGTIYAMGTGRGVPPVPAPAE